jgi:LuxR family maltose regulon positive regulatory protein
MLADADQAVQWFAAAGIAPPIAALCRGIALVLSGDLDGADASLAEATSKGAEIGAPDVIATAWCERSLLAVARGDWSSAEDFAAQADLVMRGAGMEDMLVCAVQTRVALHGGDVTAARRELVRAQRLRPLMTYVQPHLAVQARLEVARVQFALADMAGARTLMREIDEILKHRDRGRNVPVPAHRQVPGLSIYRKLGASSRNQAVTRSRELGLLEG